MKRLGNLIEHIADYDNLLLAYIKARRGKILKQEVVEFASNIDKNIAEIRDSILTADVKVGNYKYFKIRDPKPRVICAASFKERVLHHSIMNICHEKFERSLIYDTYATRPDKGIYLALNKAIKYISKYNYVVKLDFRKYFDSIDHSVLKKQLRHLFKDKTLIEIFDKIIDSYFVDTAKGLPIGNLTSQYFANQYLSVLDHLMKEKLRVPIYIRYMDDILMMDNDRQRLKEYVAFLERYSFENLKLTLKPPLYFKSFEGVPFLGYRVKPYCLMLTNKSKRRFQKKFFALHKALKEGEIDEVIYNIKVIPLLAFVKHAHSKKFLKNCLNKIEGNCQVALTA